jgi:hypothetical protein
MEGTGSLKRKGAGDDSSGGKDNSTLEAEEDEEEEMKLRKEDEWAGLTGDDFLDYDKEVEWAKTMSLALQVRSSKCAKCKMAEEEGEEKVRELHEKRKLKKKERKKVKAAEVQRKETELDHYKAMLEAAYDREKSIVQVFQPRKLQVPSREEVAINEWKKGSYEGPLAVQIQENYMVFLRNRRKEVNDWGRHILRESVCSRDEKREQEEEQVL